ncbi:MAG: hypothetical protein ACTHLA_04985 [Asticcacaulis sp.]|uniref:hypothetical protein n=1 Tax=Asticcacaulis sp. TaxID=1872648 RepID=UPI003F7C860E
MSEPADSVKKSWFYKALPALTLMLMAPLIAELLPGATRASSAYVFPIEMLIWGSGAVFARYAVRRFRLGWLNLVLLALALAMAEELLIQQTSFAPLVIKLKGVEYGRAFGFNYIYFLWAALYEAIFVVLIPVALCELIYPQRRESGWLNLWGMIPMILLFVPACMMAWYGWNIVARPKVFHLPPYVLPVDLAVVSATALLIVVALAVGPARRRLAAPARALTPPHPLVLLVFSAGVGAALFGLVVLAFGIAPLVPPAAPVAAALVLAALMLIFVPRWQASPGWGRAHDLAAAYGAVWANCGFMFIGFGASFDLEAKIVLDLIAAGLMLWLAVVVLRR